MVVWGLPPEEEAKDGSREAVVDQVDAVQHFGASRPRAGLRDAKELLVLRQWHLSDAEGRSYAGRV